MNLLTDGGESSLHHPVWLLRVSPRPAGKLIRPTFAAKRRGSGRAGEAFPAGNKYYKPSALLLLR
jgi:hypothetical protein